MAAFIEYPTQLIKHMKQLLLGFFTIGLLISCTSDEATGLPSDETNFLVFGHFFGECIGEGCVETFLLTDTALFEDTEDDYNGQILDFTELDASLFEQVRDLTASFPDQLLDEQETIFGCPDCTDGGGLFIQYSENGTIRSWRIDLIKNNVPSYLHDFMDAVTDKISLINNN